MAATKTPNTAFNYAKTLIRAMPLQDIQYQVLDDACKLIWMADAWRWTIGTLDNLDLSGGQTDYPYVSSLSSYLYTWRAYLTNGDSIQPLIVDPELPTTAVQFGMPTRIAKVNGAATFRVYPKPNDFVGSWYIIQQYKKVAPTISGSNGDTAGALVMDDEWFHVYEAAVVYYALVYAFDKRAGEAQYDPGKGVVYTGQLGVVMALIDNMRRHEPIAMEWVTSPEVPARRR